MSNQNSTTFGIVGLAGIDEDSFIITRTDGNGVINAASNNTVKIKPVGHGGASDCYDQHKLISSQDAPPTITMDTSGC